MKYLLSTFTTTIAVGMFMTAPPVLAQTPDGDTPAQETVCDALQEDGITKGLYGLCVAFCEAGDYADEADTITPEELATLETSSPSGRILANYNKKKDKANNPNDPDMPCILVEEPCPCWTADELASTADGIHNITGNLPERVACWSLGSIVDGGEGWLQTYDWSSNPGTEAIQEQMLVRDQAGEHMCRFLVFSPNTPRLVSQLSIEAGTLTEAQHASCVAQALAHWDSRTECTEGTHP